MPPPESGAVALEWFAREMTARSKGEVVVEFHGGTLMTKEIDILNAVKAGKGAYGYNAANGEFGDMLEAGILDPTKVTRLALQNAASVAGLLLTTEVMIADAPKDESDHQHGPPGGGMGDMGM